MDPYNCQKHGRYDTPAHICPRCLQLKDAEIMRLQTDLDAANKNLLSLAKAEQARQSMMELREALQGSCMRLLEFANNAQDHIADLKATQDLIRRILGQVETMYGE